MYRTLHGPNPKSSVINPHFSHRYFFRSRRENKNAVEKRMALVSGGRSTLNPDAPLFIPAAYRQVEDFSPEWWQLVTTSTWFRDYWLSQHQGEDGFYDNAEDYDFDGFEDNVVDLLPDTFDLEAGEDFFQLQEFVDSCETEADGFESGAAAPKKDATIQSAKNVSPKCSP